MATMNKIFIGIDNEVIELNGEDKKNFLKQLEIDQALEKTQKAEAETRQIARLSALQKLGLTEEEINAIL